MTMKRFFVWLLLLSASLTVFGQKDFHSGYVITNDNDTLRGLVGAKSNTQNSKSCVFQNQGEQILQSFSPDEIKAFRIEDKYYVAKDIKIENSNQRVFLEFLVDGIVDLYYLKEQSVEYYFVEKDTLLMPLSNEEITVFVPKSKHDNEKEYVRNSNQYKGTLNFIFQDSHGIQEKINNTPFEYKSLINLTKDYHNSVCKDYNCIDYTKSTKLKLFLEPYVGIINTWMGLKTSDDYAYNLKPYMGIQLRFKPIKSLTSWNFLLGISYSTNELEGDFDNDLYNYSSSTSTYKIYTKYSILRIPLTFEYALPTRGKLQPCFSFSYVNVILLNTEYSSVPDAELLKLYNYQYGFSGGLGIKYNMQKGSYLILKNEFEYRMPSVNDRNVLSYLQHYSWLINIGYGFSL